jgi:hypothetical protein
MTILWLLIYLIVSNGGRHGGFLFNPINWWTGSLIVALGIDLINLNRG